MILQMYVVKDCGPDALPVYCCQHSAYPRFSVSQYRIQQSFTLVSKCHSSPVAI
ncbi:hypothetical protein OBBRIDRAFT_108863 [Obba rivulosa]|uniref:Uncharacterized protein n=1 Tax=Obba rivulosa TaxID=1052685 RepID=A0A8E2ANT6_9APHY|nr:hypothetical protein OBBRIDRAFT_108863 [Obba rivulosa]